MGALAELVHEMPAKPVARAVREALNASRLARMRWDGSMHSLKAEIQLLQDNAASRRVAEEASAANESIEKSREIGRLQGQVDALQKQSKDAVQRERMLKEKVLEAEEDIRNEQKASVEIRQKCNNQEQTIQDLKETIANLQRPPPQVPREAEIVQGKPKCGFFRFRNRK